MLLVYLYLEINNLHKSIHFYDLYNFSKNFLYYQ